MTKTKLARDLIKLAKTLLSETNKSQKPTNTKETNAKFLEWLKNNLNDQSVKTVREMWEKKFNS